MILELALKEWFDTYVVTNEYIGTEHFVSRDDSELFRHQVESLFSAMTGRHDEDGCPPAPMPRVEEIEMTPQYTPYKEIVGYTLSISQPSPGPFHRKLSVLLYWDALTKDPDATGTDAAWAIVAALADGWLTLVWGIK